METTSVDSCIRHDWQTDEVEALFALPFNDLIFQAQTLHRKYFDANTLQVSTLLSVKTGACPEDCKYCPQSVRYDTGLERESLMDVDDVVAAAKRARDAGATRFCMGAAWRSPKRKDLDAMCRMVEAVKALGMETCVTAGMLTGEQAQTLSDHGLDYYNHNVDTSPEYYDKVITTRTFEDRLDTLEHVREAGLNVCCGGIIGMGETVHDRARMLQVLANLPEHPGSVPINHLIQVPGTPFHGLEAPDPLDFVRTIAVARIMMPRSYVRLSAGRTEMSDETQALCFLAGANSIFYGDKLLTTDNPDADHDRRLLERLGLRFETMDGETVAPPVAGSAGQPASA